MRSLLAIVVAAACALPARAEDDLEALWRDACLWEVGSNTEKVPAARNKLIAAGGRALEMIVPAKLDTMDGLVTRAAQVVLGGIAKAENAELRAQAVQRLTAALSAPQANVRRNAAEILGQIGATEAAEAIAKLLEDKETRLGALRALGGLKLEATAPAVVRLLGSDALERQRIEAVATLAAIGGAAARDALLEALGNPCAPIRFAAQVGLVKLKAVDGLRAKLADPSLRVRLHALAALGQIGDATAWPDVRARLDDPDPTVRGFAAEAITPSLGPADHDAIRARLAAESDPFARAKLEAALKQTDKP